MSFAPRQYIDSTLRTNKVVIFSTTYCPYCDKAKDAIKKLGVPYKAVELNTDANGGAIAGELYKMTGMRSVPNIFVNGTHLGGCDDALAAIKCGLFQKLLSGN